MRKIFLLMQVSLDGYFQDANHDISWAHDDGEAFSADQSRDEVDALLFGHTTYDMMKAFWPTPQAKQTAPEIAKVMNEKQKYVTSHKPFDPGWQNVTVLSGNDIVKQIKALKEGPGKTIGVFGSNKLCVSLIEAGLLDELQIILNPVALGEGTPLFKGLPKPHTFTLAETKKFKSGKLLMTFTRAA